MPDFWLGVITPFAIIGAVLVAGALAWLALNLIPEGIWWTVKRLPLHDQYTRDRAAAVVGASRRAYILRIPLGVRLIVSLGVGRDEQEEVLSVLRRGRRVDARASAEEIP